MSARLRAAAIAISLAPCFVGCAPKEMFSGIDRHCFVADWTNHYSCVSCCRNGGCGQAQPNVQYEMLVLGEQPAVSPPVASPFEDDRAGHDIALPVETTSD